MKANTIRLDEPLLMKIKPFLLPKQTLASYVRTTLEADIKKKIMDKAAVAFNRLLEEDAEEKRLFSEWESAPLENAPKQKINSKKKNGKR